MSGNTGTIAEFGWRDGYRQMGSYKAQGGVFYIFVPTGGYENPQSGTVNAWIAAGGPWTNVVMIYAYEPVYVERFPTRAAVAGGTACSFPSVEADALVVAGVATYA